MKMATIPKLIKAMLDFGRMLPEQVLAFGYSIVKSMAGNPNFTTLPVDLAALKSVLDAYAVSIADAKDGSRKAMTLRDKQGEQVMLMLRGLGLYVELNCKADMNTFLSSGFTPRTKTRTPAQPLDKPTIEELVQGMTGQLLAWVKPVRKAKHYELRIGPVGSGGAAPTTWVTQTVPNAKSAAPINGLTPGTTYAVQVRAYGQLGYTEWSDSSTRMCI